jgi:hypothetical protein
MKRNTKKVLLASVGVLLPAGNALGDTTTNNTDIVSRLKT